MPIPPALRPRRFRPPARVKRWLVLAWNWGVHRLRRLGDVAFAVGSGRVARCEACGRLAAMVYRRRVIPAELARRWGLTERLARALARKESLECLWCGAKLRARRLARILLDLYPGLGPPSLSVAAWVRTPAACRLRVAEFNRVDGLHDVLRGLPQFEAAEYVEGTEPGAVVAGVRHEDLTRLTYTDDSFDLIISSETLEHVPNLAAALCEIHRVLVPGGVHVFTIPMLPGVPSTFTRASVAADGTIEHHKPPIFHPGGDHGWLVCTEFGADFPLLLQGFGYDVKVHFDPVTLDDLAQVYVGWKC